LNKVSQFTYEDVQKGRISFRHGSLKINQDVTTSVTLGSKDRQGNTGVSVTLQINIINNDYRYPTSTNIGSTVSGTTSLSGIGATSANGATSQTFRAGAAHVVDNGVVGGEDFVYGPGAGASPVPLLTLAGSKRYGRPNRWDAHDPKNLAKSVEDFFQNEAGDEGNGSEEVVSGGRPGGNKTWHMRFGENSLTGSTPFSPIISTNNANIFRARLFFKAASQTPDDSSIIVTGANGNKATSFAVEILHSSTENGLQVRVIETELDEAESKTDVAKFSQYAFLATRGGADARAPKFVAVRPDQYTAKYSEDTTEDKKYTSAEYLGAGTHESCSNQKQFEGKCALLRNDAAAICTAWASCEAIECDDYASKTHCVALSSKGTGSTDKPGVSTTTVKNNINGCVGVVCAGGTTCEDRDVGYECVGETKGLVCNEKKTICYREPGRYERRVSEETAKTHRTIVDHLDTDVFHSVEIMLRQSPGCGNDVLLVTVNGEQRNYLREHDGEANSFRPALECVEGESKPSSCLNSEGTEVTLPAGCRCIVYENFGTDGMTSEGSTATFQGPLSNFPIGGIRNGALVGISQDSSVVECVQESNENLFPTALKFVASHPFSDTAYHAPGVSGFDGRKDRRASGPQGFHFDDIQYSSGQLASSNTQIPCDDRNDCAQDDATANGFISAGSDHFISLIDQFATSFEGNRATGPAGLDNALSSGSLSTSVWGSGDAAPQYTLNSFEDANGGCRGLAGAQPSFDLAADSPNAACDHGSFDVKQTLYFSVEESAAGGTAISPGQTMTIAADALNNKAPHAVINTGMQVLEYNGVVSTQALELRKFAQGYPGCLDCPGSTDYQTTAQGWTDAANPAKTFATRGSYPATGVLDKSLLSYGDVDTWADAELKFTITSQPTLGHIAKCGNPALGDKLDRLSKASNDNTVNEQLKTPLTFFHQYDLTHARLCYVHTAGELGLENATDSFTFSVSDGTHSVDGQVFNIVILPVDNVEPVVTTKASVLKDADGKKGPASESVVITSAEISAQDADTESSELVFLVKADGSDDFPSLGSLQVGVAECIDFPFFVEADISKANLDGACPASPKDCNENGGRDSAWKHGTTEDQACCACGGGIRSDSTYYVAFTKAQLDAGVVTYTRNDVDHTRPDSFKFSVLDGDDKSGPNAASTKHTWNVVVPAADNEAPVQSGTASLEAFEGHPTLLTSKHINLSDNSVDATEIVITTPANTPGGGSWKKLGGRKRRNEDAVDPFTFTMQDVLEGKIIYVAPENDDLVAGASIFDRITMSVSDGSNTFVFVFTVTVKAYADGQWEISPNPYGAFVIAEGKDTDCPALSTNDLLLAYKDGSGASKFTVEGTSSLGSFSKAEFTNEDLVNGLVTFCQDTILVEGADEVIVYSEEVKINVEFTPSGDRFGTETRSVKFTVAVALVDDKAPTASATDIDIFVPQASILLTRDDVPFTDADTTDDSLIYTVATVPTTADVLRKNGEPLGVAGTFNNADLDSGAISLEVGGKAVDAGAVIFQISAKDPAGNTAMENLEITAVWSVVTFASAPPSIVAEGGFVDVTIQRSHATMMPGSSSVELRARTSIARKSRAMSCSRPAKT
jgi:hypothetical protein